MTPRQTAFLSARCLATSPGNDSQFRGGVTELGRPYIVGVQSNMLVWKADAVLPPQGAGGRKPSPPQNRAQQISAKGLALDQPAEAWQAVTWREDGEAVTSRFARLRVRPVARAEQPAEEWLLIEWPEDEAEPSKYWLSTLPVEIGFEALVDGAKLRWRIERDYQDLKQEVGLGHYEGRGWRGLHHHVTLCIAAYGFLVAERAAFPPSGPTSQGQFTTIAVSPGSRSNGAPAAFPATYSGFDRDTQATIDGRTRRISATMPLLRRRTRHRGTADCLTQ